MGNQSSTDSVVRKKFAKQCDKAFREAGVIMPTSLTAAIRSANGIPGVLNLSGSGLNDNAAIVVCRTLLWAGESFHTLDLSNNGLTDFSAREIHRLFTGKQTTLRQLNVSNNNFSGEGITLMRALGSFNLTVMVEAGSVIGGGMTTVGSQSYVVPKTIADNYQTLEEVQNALRTAGLESSNLIIGVDFTKSNVENGRHTFGGRSLHYLDPEFGIQNPYEQVIRIVGNTLEAFDDDKLIPAFGFGDHETRDQSVFQFDHKPCYTFSEVLGRYRQIAPIVTLSGPTSFAPIINKAIEIVRQTKQYHILIIIADGQVIKVQETVRAIVAASNYPLSIIMVGVGDGPWQTMKEFDDGLPERKFDNFQFVNFHEVMAARRQNQDAAFATAALMEIPEQFLAIRQLGLLDM